MYKTASQFSEKGYCPTWGRTQNILVIVLKEHIYTGLNTNICLHAQASKSSFPFLVGNRIVSLANFHHRGRLWETAAGLRGANPRAFSQWFSSAAPRGRTPARSGSDGSHVLFWRGNEPQVLMVALGWPDPIELIVETIFPSVPVVRVRGGREFPGSPIASEDREPSFHRISSTFQGTVSSTPARPAQSVQNRALAGVMGMTGTADGVSASNQTASHRIL